MAAPRKASSKAAPGRKQPAKAAAAQPGTKAQACAAYCQAKAAGQSNVAALAAAQRVAPIGHSVADLAWYAHPANPNQVVPIAALANANQATLAQATVALRGGAGWQGQYQGQRLSWGAIVVALGLYNPADAKSAEGQVRTLFGQGTAAAGMPIAAEGTRKGHGGRWLGGKAELYPGNYKGIGVEAAKPRQVDPAQQAATAATATSKVQALAQGKRQAKAKVQRAAKATKAKATPRKASSATR